MIFIHPASKSEDPVYRWRKKSELEIMTLTE